VGAAALEGSPGVLQVTKGWRGFREINEVTYDPQQITMEQLEQKLKQAGTYVKTVP
jgi:peptide methionine sulfoxide reductase MsrA